MMKKKIMSKPFRWNRPARSMRAMIEAEGAPPPAECWKEFEQKLRRALTESGARPSEIAMTISKQMTLFDQVLLFTGREHI